MVNVQSSGQWNKMWNLSMPGKVGIFLWRFAHNSLPLRMNIKRKGVELDTRCPVCNRLDEDGGHLFLKCKFVKHVWRALDLEETRIALLELTSPMAVLEHLCTLDNAKRDVTLIMLWEWWSARNKINAGGPARTTEDISFMVRQHVQDFYTAPKIQTEVAGNRERSCWQKPPSDFVKINFDAAYSNNTGSGAWGCVARSDQGEFLAAAAGKLDHLTGPLHAEAEACVKAVEASAGMGLHRVHFESDSQVLVKALKSDDYERSMIGVLLREIRSLCFANFDSFDFGFCSRDCNKVAHELAAYGVLYG